MKFVSVRELRSQTAAIRKQLEEHMDMVVTTNGKPFALLVRVDPDRVEEELRAIRQARANLAIDRMQAAAKAAGLDGMTMDEIDEIIAETRRERLAARERG